MHTLPVQPTDGTVADTIGPWIEHNAPAVNPAWSFEKAIEEKRSLPVPPEQVTQKKDRFRSVMRGILRRSSSPEYQSIFETSTTWEEVRAEAQNAIDLRYQGHNSNNFFRKSIRTAGLVASRFEFLTVLLPQGDYLGVLCGGLTLVYNAATRIETIRGLIVDSLASLSYSINETLPYFHVYAWNAALMERAHDLYLAVLDAVEWITRWIGEHSGFRGGLRQAAGAFFQGDNYGKDLEDAVTTTVSEKANAFEAAVRACLSIEVHDTGLNVVQVGKGLEQVYTNVNKLLQSTVSKDALEQILQEQVEGIVHKALATFRQSPAPQPVLPAITLQQVLMALNFTPAFGGNDVVDEVISVVGAERNSVLFYGRALGEGTQHHVAGVVQDPRFQHWLRSLESGTLAVWGMLVDVPVDAAAPLSYVCGLLMRSVSAVRFIHPIAFFCRLHLDLKDAFTGAVGIMRSLIAQLALSLSETGDLDLGYLARDYHQFLALQDLRSMCRVFEDILKPLRNGVILCMIDGTDFFDNALNRPGMHLLMPFLNSLVEAIARGGNGLVFKLLVTSHVGGGYLPEWFPRRVDIHMTEEVLLHNEVEAYELEEYGIQGV